VGETIEIEVGAGVVVGTVVDVDVDDGVFEWSKKQKAKSKSQRVQKAIKSVPVKVIKAAEEVETGLFVKQKVGKWTKVGKNDSKVRSTVTGVAG
jgi:hypothetical protein